MSLALRAVVAIALTVVFYVFAVAVMAGLEPQDRKGDEAGESVGLVGLMAPAVAITIVVKLVPRRDRFTEPGPRVTRADQPERGRVLFDRLLAAGVGEAPLVEATADPAADAAPAAPRVDHERADEPVPADTRRERPSRPRRALAGLGRTYAVAWTLLFVLLLLAGPGMIIGYDVAGRPGEAIGALILPAAIGAFLVHRRRRRGTVAS